MKETAYEIYMKEQEKHPVSFGSRTLPEQWQLDAMEAYANSKITEYCYILKLLLSAYQNDGTVDTHNIDPEQMAINLISTYES